MGQSDIRTGPAVVADLGALDPVRCLCGWARRAFAGVPDAPASVHRVEIEADARAHYHRDHTEIYTSWSAPPGRRWSWTSIPWRWGRAC
jgi:hypothetical protein